VACERVKPTSIWLISLSRFSVVPIEFDISVFTCLVLV